MFPTRKPAITSMKRTYPYYDVRKDREGNDLRVGDFVTVLSSWPHLHDVYYKIKELGPYQAMITSLGPKKSIHNVGFLGLIKAEHSPELTAYILKNCGD